MVDYDVVVIGGGVVGAAAAHRAAAAGAGTLLVDRRDTGRATDAGAGIIAPAVSRTRGPVRDLGDVAGARYGALIDELAACGQPDVGFARNGLLAVCVTDDELWLFEHWLDEVVRRRRQVGHPTGHEVERIEPDEARRRYPVLGHVSGAFFDTGAARVDGRLLDAALLGAAAGAGAEISSRSVSGLVVDGSTVGVVMDGWRRRTAGAVVIAGGAWSDSFAEQLGVTIPVAPQRGQIIHLQVTGREAQTGVWPVLSPLGDEYHVAWPGGRVAVGATRETGSGFDPRATVSGVRKMLDAALAVAPGLSDAELVEVRIGLRPLSADGVPVLGRVPGAAGVVVATGHGPLGLTLGPLSGQIAADLALGLGTDVDIEPFALDRFSR